jgi:transcriptional regulator with XRE-family HTH domain
VSALREYREQRRPKAGPNPRPVVRMRCAKGWSQVALAGRAGVSMEVLVRLERGQIAELRVSSLVRIAAALSCSVLDLIPALQVRGLPGWEALAGDEAQPVARKVRRTSSSAGPATQAAMRWLSAQLEGGPVQGRVLREHAKRAGISASALDKAQLALGVVAFQTPGFGQPWQWRLQTAEERDAAV